MDNLAYTPLSPLDRLLGKRSKVMILRLLDRSGDRKTGREIARVLGLSPRTAQISLGELLRDGAVSMNVTGAGHLYSLNRERYFVRDVLGPLFEAEGNMFETLVKDAAKLVGKDAMSLAIFGSVARGEAARGSDLDILVILKDGADPRAAEHRILEGSDEIRSRYGLGVDPHAYTKSEFIRRYRRRERLIREMIEDAWIRRGLDPAEIIQASGVRRETAAR